MEKEKPLTNYAWGGDSLITRVDVRRQHNGFVAYLHARDSEPAQSPTLQAMRTAFRHKGWMSSSDRKDGQFVLRLTGIRDEQQLISLLQDSQYVTGEPTITQEKLADNKPKNAWEGIRQNSLRLSGMVYSLGNSLYIGQGLHRSIHNKKMDWGQLGSGLMWSTGDVLLATIGGKDDSRQFTTLTRKLKEHYDKNGVEIPKTSAINVETADKGDGFLSKGRDWAREHLNQIKCGSEVLAAAFYYKAGHDHKLPEKKATALIFGTGFALSGLIPEKKIDPEKYQKANFFEKVWMKIQENPLSLGGMSGWSNTILTTRGAVRAQKEYNAAKLKNPAFNDPRFYRWDYAAPAVMFFGNGLYAASPKTTGGGIGTDEMVSDIYGIAAQIINKQPDDKREHAVQTTADFLSERPEIKDTRDVIVTRLREKIDVQVNNPWFEKVKLAGKPDIRQRRGQRDAAGPATEALMAQSAAMADGLQR